MLENKNALEFTFSEASSSKVNGEVLFSLANDIDRNIRFNYINKQIMIIIDKPKLKDNILNVARKLFIKIFQNRIM